MPTYAWCCDLGNILCCMFCPYNRIHTGALNSCKCETFGFLPCHAWYGVAVGNAVVYDKFCKYAACAITSSQRNSGSFAPINITCASSSSIWFMSSVIPFWDSEYGAVIWRSIPCPLHMLCKLALTNSVLQSICILQGLLLCALRWAIYSITFCVAWLFCFRKWTVTYHVVSSTSSR